jgi:hypothetical protein
MTGIESRADPALAGPMLDQGLLTLLEPEWFVDKEMTEQLSAAMVELLTTDVFASLSQDDPFAELSMSRMGVYGERELFNMILGDLKQLGLARDTADGVSIPMHTAVRRAYLILLAQFARHAGRRHGLTLHPTTNHQLVGAALGRILSTDHTPSQGHLVELDLQTIGYDLEPVPLEEILDYRKSHGDEHRKYMRNLRQFLGEIALAGSDDEREALYRDRAAELQETASRLRRHVQSAWNQPGVKAGFGLGIIGAAWSIAAHDVVGTCLTIGALGEGLNSLMRTNTDSSAYSYLFSAGRELPYIR